MALYRLSVSTIRRSQGRSAVAAAAYRAGERMTDARTGRTHDYRRRSRGIVAARLVGWTGTRTALWDAAEGAERRRDGQTAREVCVALPAELPDAARVALALDFARWLRARFAVAVDVAVHRPGARGDGRNHHAHLLMTTRTVEGEQLGAKVRTLDTPATSGREVEAMRAAWAEATNRALEAHARPERVEHRSHARRGVRRESEHQGRATREVEQRTGARTAEGDRVRQRRRRNRVRGAVEASGAALTLPAPIGATPTRRRRPAEAPSSPQEARSAPRAADPLPAFAGRVLREMEAHEHGQGAQVHPAPPGAASPRPEGRGRGSGGWPPEGGAPRRQSRRRI